MKKKNFIVFVFIFLLSLGVFSLVGCEKNETKAKKSDISMVNPNGPKFLKGILLDITYGDMILLDEYIEYVDEEYTIIAKDADGIETDLTYYPAWTPTHPGKYTITYTILEGENKGSNSFELTVSPKKIAVELNFRSPYFVNGESIDFESYFDSLNINVDSYYDYEVVMEYIEHNGERTDIEKNATSYTFNEGGIYTVHFYIKSLDGQVKNYKEDITVYAWNSEFYDWMKENNVSGYKIGNTTADRLVELTPGTHDGRASDFPFGGLTHDLGFLAFNGDYKVGDYVIVDFTGDNMPALSFFRDEVIESYFWGQYYTNAQNKGISVVNGFRLLDGSNAPKFASERNGLVNIYGTMGIEHQDQGTIVSRQYLNGSVNSDLGIEDIQAKYANTKMRMFAGFSGGDNKGVTFDICVINLDTFEIISSTSTHVAFGEGAETSVMDLSTFYSGSIALFGTHGKSIVLDKVYPIEKQTNIADLVEKYCPMSEFKDNVVKTVSDGQVLNVSDYIAPAQGDEYVLKYINQSGKETVITGDTFSFEAPGTYKLVYQCGIRYPRTITINVIDHALIEWLENSDITIGNADIDGNHKVVFAAGATENGAGSPAKAEGYLGYVAYDGNYGAGDYIVVDFTGNNMPAISFMRNTIADDYTNGENIQADKYKAITLFNGYTDVTGADGWKMDALYLTGMYGIANIGGGPGFNVQQYLMDKVSEDFGMLDLASSTTKYRMIAGIASITDNGTNVSFEVEVAIINLDTNKIILSVKKSYNAPTAQGYGTEGKIEIFGVYGKSITLDKIYEVKENTNLSSILLDYSGVKEWFDENNMFLGYAMVYEDHKVDFSAGLTANGAGSPAKAEGYLGYVAYDGNYGAGDFVVVDFTGNNMPAISFMRNTIADDYTNGENIQAAKYKAVTLFNGYTDATGADGWKMDALYLTGMYGIANIGGGHGFNVQQYLMEKVSEDFGMLDLANSTTKYRMIAGISSITDNGNSVDFTISVAIINLDTNEVVLKTSNSYNAPCAEGYGTEGKIEIFGVYGKAITLDKIYALEENTDLETLVTKYSLSK